jgi:hypothetical protein
MTELQSLSVAVEVQQELFTTPEELALTGFLAGYSGLTLDAYRLDLRQFVAWCTERDIRIFGARRVDIEQFSRHLEALGKARATVARRLGTIVCFYRYAEEASSNVPRLSTSAGPAWTTNRTRPAWTATKSGPCSSPLVSRALGTTRCCPC